ncbi:MAG: hypothetical protein PF638_01250 [Candidatus Delongbacteria bacterium]|jgi:hypothetical protein|nr:hypothetical protein [Candidatus Delongbacteria bacterium]
MKNFEKLQIVVILTSLIAIGVTAFQVTTMSTQIKDESQSKYQASVDSVKQTDSIYIKFKSSTLLANRDIGNFNIKIVEEVVEKVEKVKKVETYWVNSGIELYKKDKLGFTMYFDGKATFNMDGKNQKLEVGDKLAVGKILMKQRYKDSNKLTGNTKLGKEYSGRILAVAARYVYVEHFKSNLAIKYKPNQDATSISKDLVPTESTQKQDTDTKKSDDDDDDDDGGGRRRR